MGTSLYQIFLFRLRKKRQEIVVICDLCYATDNYNLKITKAKTAIILN